MWRRHHEAMPVGVVDVGSNTVRLLVEVRGQPVLSERELLRLGADVEQDGRISPEKLELAAEVVAGFAADARAAGVTELEVLITSPGRQAENGGELLARLEAAAGFPARILTAVEEGRLAFVGAIALARPAGAAPRGRRRRRRRLGAGRRRNAPRRPAVGALDRSRLTAADEPPARW